MLKTIFKFLFGEVYHRIYDPKSCFTALLTGCSKTKFLSISNNDIPPQMKQWKSYSLLPSITGDAIICLSAISKQRTNGPVNVHLISWPSKAQYIQNLENIK